MVENDNMKKVMDLVLEDRNISHYLENTRSERRSARLEVVSNFNS